MAGGDSEPSDEEAAAFSAESRDSADEDAPGPAARAQEPALLLGGAAPAEPQEGALPEDGVDLLGLHSEAGPAPPAQACGAPPSNADLLSCLLGGPEAAPEGPPGGLLGSEAPLLFASPALPPSARSTPREGPTAAGTWGGGACRPTLAWACGAGSRRKLCSRWRLAPVRLTCFFACLHSRPI